MTKKILAIDGGGMYGVVSLEVCIAIEEATGKQLRDLFDFFVGTSTGALIVASAVAGLGGDRPFGLPATTIMEQYYDLGKNIFTAKNPNIEIPFIDLGKYPKYEAQALRMALNKAIGERKIGKYDKDISISAYNMSQGKPHFFRSWVDTEPNANQDVFLRDAVRASASAPTYHPLVEIDGSFYTDGGVFAGNPTYYALGQALDLYPGENLLVVSIGTGIRHHEFDPSNRDTVTWWAKNIADALLGGQNKATDEVMNQVAQKSNWLEYFRFDVDLPQQIEKRADELNENTLQKVRDLMQAQLAQDRAKFNRMIAQLT